MPRRPLEVRLRLLPEDDEESVLGLVPLPERIPSKPPIYHSSFQEHPPAEKQARTKATFGKPNGTNSLSPQQFIKKNSRQPLKPSVPTCTTHRVCHKEPLPNRHNIPRCGLVTTKNFVKANALEAILAEPGNVLAPVVQYTSKPDYGTVPAYLARNKAQLVLERQQSQQEIKPDEAAPMAAEEREELLHHLKEKWAELNKAFQKLTFVLDTPSSKRRKENLEQKLQQIEADVRTLEKGQVIFVVRD